MVFNLYTHNVFAQLTRNTERSGVLRGQLQRLVGLQPKLIDCHSITNTAKLKSISIYRTLLLLYCKKLAATADTCFRTVSDNHFLFMPDCA